MAVREYIGARYVPVFGYKDETGTTQMQWVNTRMYEPLVVMQNQGNSYISVQTVPVGVDITNTEYWLLTYQFNAQYGELQTQVASATQASNAATNAANKASADVAALDTKVSGYDNAIDEVSSTANNAMSQVVQLKQSVEGIEQRYIKEYDTLTALKADSANLNVTAVQTLGNTTIADGGGALYRVYTSVPSITPYIELGNGKYAVAISSASQGGGGGGTATDRVKLLCIGDSYLQGYNGTTTIENNWGKLLSEYLGTSVYHAVALGGAGWYAGGSSNGNFVNAIETAHTTYSNPDDFNTIVVAGGINDCRASSTAPSATLATTVQQVEDNTKELCNLIAQYYPNAKVYLVPNLWCWRYYGIDNEARANAVQRGANLSNNSNVNVIMGAWTWLYGKSAYYGVDGIHPVESAQRVFAKNIKASMEGTDCTVMYDYTVLGSNNNAAISVRRSYLEVNVTIENAPYLRTNNQGTNDVLFNFNDGGSLSGRLVNNYPGLYNINKLYFVGFSGSGTSVTPLYMLIGSSYNLYISNNTQGTGSAYGMSTGMLEGKVSW